ncbi:AfsA-related hotdog domain-containing protein [Streptomyces sp. NPDC008159]|uniref:AfsA-related hotdog domain-containing protein n=1 Tax=Streptomyces sp. NPDC008159 TaxID=3364817 RepID=UPI0036ED05EB
MLRGRRDDADTPTSESYRQPVTEGLGGPGRVGRRRPGNVVLPDPVTEGRRDRARLRVAGGHPSLFDHAQDHVPGMVPLGAPLHHLQDGRGPGATEGVAGEPVRELARTGRVPPNRAARRLLGDDRP